MAGEPGASEGPSSAEVVDPAAQQGVDLVVTATRAVNTGGDAPVDGPSQATTVFAERSTVLANATDPAAVGVTMLDSLAQRDAQIVAENEAALDLGDSQEGGMDDDVESDGEPPVVPGTGEGSAPTQEGPQLGAEDEAKLQEERAKIEKARVEALRAAQKDLLADVEALRDQDLTREGMLALAVDSHLNRTAFQPVWERLHKLIEVKSFKDSGIIRKLTTILGPVDQFGRAMVQRSINETNRASEKQDALIQEQGRAVINILSHENATPEMKALALDAQIPTAFQKLTEMSEGSESDALKAKIAEMKAARSKLTQEDGSEIPNKFVEMAHDFAGLLEERGVVPEEAKLHPTDYIQKKLVEVAGDKKTRNKLMKGLEAAGKISKEDSKELTKLIALPEKGPTIEGMKFLANILKISGGMAIVALYFRLREESKQAAGGGGGGGRRGH